MKHILSGCKNALHQGRYGFRHDNVLRDLLSAIKGFIEHLKDQELQDPSSGVDFVREGKGPKRIVRSKRKDGLLRLAQDWKVTADLDEQENYVFPPYLATTAQRPDILLESASTRRVLLIELTCPSEENIDWANQRKRKTYKDLIRKIKTKKWIVDYFPIEVGARGYCAENVRSCLSRLGFSGKKTKSILKIAGRNALTASFTIWLSRASHTWNPNGDAAGLSAKAPTGQNVANAFAEGSGHAVPSGRSATPSQSIAEATPKQPVSDQSNVSYATLLKKNKPSRSASAQVPPPSEISSGVPSGASAPSTTPVSASKVTPLVQPPATPKPPTSQGRSKEPSMVPTQSKTPRTKPKRPRKLGKTPVPRSDVKQSNDTDSENRNPCTRTTTPPPNATQLVRKICPTGILNKGNTCYLNAILQALSVFSEYYSTCPEKPGILSTFLSTMKLLSTERRIPIDPKDLLVQLQREMRSTIRDFNWNEPQDVPHILGFLMEKINTESPTARTLSETRVRTVTTCSACSYESAKLDNQPFLHVPVRDSLPAMLEEFSSSTVMEGNNGYMCPQCSPTQKIKAFQREEVASAPLMLVVVMRRYEKNSLQGPMHPAFIRSTQHVNPHVKLELLVKSDSGVEQKARYESMALIHNQGSLCGVSHYFAHIKKNQRWFKCNDRAVTPSVPTTGGNETSFVILCKRVALLS